MLDTLVVRVAGAAALSLAIGAATPAMAQGALDGVLLRGGGSSFAAPLFQGWIETLAKGEPGLSVDYDLVGSGEGMARFVTGSLDFAGTDAPMSPNEAALVEDGVLQLPLAGGLIAICYNVPGLAGELRLPRDVYAGIFDGAITEWNDKRIAAANPGMELPKRSIAVVVRRDGSGTTFAFTNHLNSIDPNWREQGHGAAIRVDWPGGAMTARGNEGVAATILQSEYSIGYVEFGFAQRLGLSMAALENKEGTFVAPNLAAGQAAFAGGSDAATADLVQFLSDPRGVELLSDRDAHLEPGQSAVPGCPQGRGREIVHQLGLGRGTGCRRVLQYVTLSPELAAASRAALDTVQ